jgi:hypothetical protein
MCSSLYLLPTVIRTDIITRQYLSNDFNSIVHLQQLNHAFKRQYRSALQYPLVIYKWLKKVQNDLDIIFGPKI